MTESWRPIPGHAAYEASSEGRIRRAAPGRGTRAGRVRLAQRNPVNGYLSVMLSEPATGRIRRYVHALVAAAFLGPRPPGHESNHKDGDKTNCRASNLEWSTSSANKRHALKLGLLATGMRNGAARYTDAEVDRVRALAAAGVPQSEVARRAGMDKGHVSRIVRGLARAA